MTDRNGAMTETRSLVAPTAITAQGLENVLIGGDLSKLSPADRVSYYEAVCKSLGLNPLTQPFQYITLNGKLVLYARRDATDQLRSVNHVNITRLVRERYEDVYTVTASASTTDGRQDESMGAVSIAGLKGEALANAMMKGETKAKRRVTLSIVGLGWLDETEVETIPSATIESVNHETGEIVGQPQLAAPQAPQPPPRRPLTDAEVNAGYDQLVDKAIPLGVGYKARLDTWPRSQTIEEGQGLRNRIRVAEESGAAKA